MQEVAEQALRENGQSRYAAVEIAAIWDVPRRIILPRAARLSSTKPAANPNK